VVELKALLSQLRSQLTEVAPCPGVNTRVEEEVRSALGHELHSTTQTLPCDKAHHVW